VNTCENSTREERAKRQPYGSRNVPFATFRPVFYEEMKKKKMKDEDKKVIYGPP
jgi:hypothetical protein